MPPQTKQSELPTEPTPPKIVSVTPPIAPTSSAPTTSEPFITISATEFLGVVQTLRIVTTTHTALFQQMAVMRAQQEEQMVILRQIQQHLGCLPSPQPNLPSSSKPVAPVADTIPPEDGSFPP